MAPPLIESRYITIGIRTVGLGQRYLRFLYCFVLLTYLRLPCEVAGFPHPPAIWQWSGSSHFDFGRDLGARFAVDIEQRHTRDTDMAGWLEPWARTAAGKQVVSTFLDTHVRLFPQFIEEV